MGLPGTGISYSTRLSGGKKQTQADQPASMLLNRGEQLPQAARPALEADATATPVARYKKPVSVWGKIGIWLCWAALFSPSAMKGDKEGVYGFTASVVLTVMTVKWLNKRRGV